MTPYPDAMKNIAQQWLPFGGPPAEEVLVRFGITLETFYRRLNYIISAEQPSATTTALAELARTKLSHTPAPRDNRSLHTDTVASPDS